MSESDQTRLTARVGVVAWWQTRKDEERMERRPASARCSLSRTASGWKSPRATCKKRLKAAQIGPKGCEMGVAHHNHAWARKWRLM